MIEAVITGIVVVVAVLMLFMLGAHKLEHRGPTEAEKVRGRLMERQAKDASRDVKRGER